MNNKITKPYIRFNRPIYRILTTILPMVIISFISALIALFGTIRSSMFTLYIGSYIVYQIVQFIFLTRFVFESSPTRYICTNILAYLSMILFCVIFFNACIFFLGIEQGNILYTWFFMPMKLFFYLGMGGKELSAFILGIISLILSLVYPIFLDYFLGK